MVVPSPELADALSRLREKEALAHGQQGLSVTKALSMVEEVRTAVVSLFAASQPEFEGWNVSLHASPRMINLSHPRFNVPIEWQQTISNSIDMAALSIVLFRHTPSFERLGEGYFLPSVRSISGAVECGWVLDTDKQRFYAANEVASFAITLLVKAIADAM
jgi:hypothetical protein